MKKNQIKNLSIVIIILAIFVGPFFLARWFFYNHASDVLSELGAVNQGQLLQPPVSLDKELHNSLKNIKAPKKWYLLCVSSHSFLSNHVKKNTITPVLDKIQRIRLSLGKQFSDVGALLILAHQKKVVMPTITQENIPEMIVPESIIKRLVAFTGGAQGIFLMDPENNVVLAYPVDMNSEAIYKDIRRLLKYSSASA